MPSKLALYYADAEIILKNDLYYAIYNNTIGLCTFMHDQEYRGLAVIILWYR
jgi:hypothetical protein